MSRIKIYSKVCLNCVYKGEWEKIRKAIWGAGYEITTYRTTYDSKLHQKATELWGNPEYIAFAEMPNGQILGLGEIRKMLEKEIKDKLVKAGKSKPVRKGKRNELRGLSKTKRHIRVDSVEDSPSEVEVEVEV